MLSEREASLSPCLHRAPHAAAPPRAEPTPARSIDNLRSDYAPLPATGHRPAMISMNITGGDIMILYGSVLGLVVLAAIFFAVERLWPAIPDQPRFRSGMITDAAYYFLNRTITRLAAGGVAIVLVLAIARIAGVSITVDQMRGIATRDTWVSGLPVPVQIVAFLLIADFAGYWMHRTFHFQPTLWRYHAIHHSSKQLDWLASVRVHPANDVIQNAAQAVPLLLLGFSPATLGAYIAVLGVFAVMLHSNVGWTFGPLRYAVASPVFHRWHHTTEKEGIDKNFAGLFPWLDLAFGTFYMPKGVQPMEFGVLGDDVPQGFFGSLAFPFRRKRDEAPQTAA
jgi:sterol desaturase/sphingolipid hydroxylase (fatty acid hydroxylase superfamily)